MTSIGVVSQARMTSTRLPGKVLARVGDATLLDHHLRRLSVSELPVLVATTSNAHDDPIVDIASRRGLLTHRGSEWDVLSRYLRCAQEHRLDVIVRVTSDCPLIDGQLIGDAVRTYLAANDPWLYLSNTIERTFPRGFDFEVFSTEALAYAHENVRDPAQREHVTPYLRSREGGRVRTRNIAWSRNMSKYRVTVDTASDLALIRELIGRYGAAVMTCGEIISVLDTHPELVALNQDVIQKGITLEEPGSL